jgi:hypothetical protein
VLQKKFQFLIKSVEQWYVKDIHNSINENNNDNDNTTVDPAINFIERQEAERVLDDKSFLTTNKK